MKDLFIEFTAIVGTIVTLLFIPGGSMKELFVAFTAIVGTIVTLLFISFLLSWPVMMLWNACLVGAVNGVQEVTWLQAWGIQFLFALLFKSTVTKKD